MENKISRRKKKVEIRDVSASSKTALGKGQMRKIAGGKIWYCPGDCDRLQVSTVVETVLMVDSRKSGITATKTIPR